MQIPVTDLRIGHVLNEGKGLRVETIDLCPGSKGRKIHVNSRLCSEVVGFVDVRKR